MGFQEFTASDGQNEVMVDVCIDTGKVLDIYTYEDCSVDVYKEKIGDFVDITKAWTLGSNLLFKHCPATQRKYVLTNMLEGDFVICCSGDNLKEIEENMDILYKMAAYYNLSSSCEANLLF